MGIDKKKGASLAAGSLSAMPAPGLLLFEGHGHGDAGNGPDTGGIDRLLHGDVVHFFDKFSRSAAGCARPPEARRARLRR